MKYPGNRLKRPGVSSNARLHEDLLRREFFARADLRLEEDSGRTSKRRHRCVFGEGGIRSRVSGRGVDARNREEARRDQHAGSQHQDHKSAAATVSKQKERKI